MQVNIYAIYDLKAGAYLQPWFAANNALAFRNCQKASMNDQSPFVQFPSDFELFHLGEFDDETGHILSYEHKKPLGNFHQFLPAAADTAA